VFRARPNRINARESSPRRRVLFRLVLCGELLETLEITGKQDEFISFQTNYRSPRVMLTTNSTLRFQSRKQFEALLARSGLVIREVFGD
jgi:hypothetical protein